MTSPIEKAYGLLWRYDGADRVVFAARRIILTQIDRAGQERGIAFAKSLSRDEIAKMYLRDLESLIAELASAQEG